MGQKTVIGQLGSNMLCVWASKCVYLCVCQESGVILFTFYCFNLKEISSPLILKLCL